MVAITVGKTLNTPNYTVYQSQGGGSSSSVDARIPKHKRTVDTLQVLTHEDIASMGNHVTHNSTSYFIQDTNTRLYLDRSSTPRRAVHGYLTLLKRDALSTLLNNSGSITGYLLKKGYETDEGLYEVDTRKDTINKQDITPTYGITVASTRAVNGDIEGNSLTVSKYAGILNISDMYDVADKYTTPSSLGTFITGYACVTDLGFNEELFYSIERDVATRTGSRDLTNNTVVNINLMGSSISFTLAEAKNSGGGYTVKPEINIFGDITGVTIGSTLHSLGVVNFGPINSEYKRFLQKQEYLGTLSWDLIWATMLNILNLAIPSTVFELPEEFKSELGWVITKHFYGGFDGLAPVKYMKAQGNQWSFDNTQAMPSFIAYNVHDLELQERARLVSGVDTTNTNLVDLATYLRTSQQGMYVAGIVTSMSSQLTAQEQSEIRSALEGGIRVL